MKVPQRAYCSEESKVMSSRCESLQNLNLLYTKATFMANDLMFRERPRWYNVNVDVYTSHNCFWRLVVEFIFRLSKMHALVATIFIYTAMQYLLFVIGIFSQNQGRTKMDNKGGSYSYIHVLHNLFLGFLVFEHEYMNMSPPPPPNPNYRSSYGHAKDKHLKWLQQF